MTHFDADLSLYGNIIICPSRPLPKNTIILCSQIQNLPKIDKFQAHHDQQNDWISTNKERTMIFLSMRWWDESVKAEHFYTAMTDGALKSVAALHCTVHACTQGQSPGPCTMFFPLLFSFPFNFRVNNMDHVRFAFKSVFKRACTYQLVMKKNKKDTDIYFIYI